MTKAACDKLKMGKWMRNDVGWDDRIGSLLLPGKKRTSKIITEETTCAVILDVFLIWNAPI